MKKTVYILSVLQHIVHLVLTRCPQVAARRLGVLVERGKRMFSVNAMSGVPVYEQLVNQVETYIATGILEAGSQLPSVRSLSVTLSVNPNTVQKAFSDLIQRGIVTAVPGKGNFVSEDALSSIREKGKRRLSELSSLVRELRLFGIEKEDILTVIEKEFRLEGGDGK